jgi:hypothetical protein
VGAGNVGDGDVFGVKLPVAVFKMIHVYFACSCFARASSGKYSGPLLPQPASKASTIANPSHFCIMVLVPFLVNVVQDNGWQRDNKER